MSKVKIYSKDYCPYCVRAKNLLREKNVAFEELMMDENPDEYIKLKARTGMMTVPQIFIGEKFVGGYTELAELNASGELDELLKALK